MSKHGGSPSSGLIQPVGVDALRAADGGLIVEPEVVVKQREEAAKRRERALQLERRRLALALLAEGRVAEPMLTIKRDEKGAPERPTLYEFHPDTRANIVEAALGLADELISKTGGDV